MADSDKYTYDRDEKHEEAEKDMETIGDDVKCGYGSCKPEVLQRFNNPKMLLFIMCIFTATQGFVVNGVNNVNTQSVERRFRLPSSRSGLVSSSYDFSAAIFGVVFSFIGSGRYKARWLCAAALVMSLGSFTMALPHFATGMYEWGQDTSHKICLNGTSAMDTCEGSELQNYLGVLMLGMILHGVGGCILYTVGVGLIDDSVDANSSPLYIGFLYGAAALGPGVGYIVGGQLLNIYVDFDKVDTDSIGLSTEDPRWVGAWWAGFFVTMTLFMLTALPLSCFGAEMPTAKSVRESRVSQMHKSETSSSAHSHGNKRLPLKLLPKVVWALLTNAPYVCTMLAGATEGILAAGFATFVPKYIQNNFGVSSGLAALYTGIAAVPGAAGGVFFGGLICKWLKLRVAGMFRFAVFTCLGTIVLVNILWISCENDKFAGVSTPYTDGGRLDGISDTCNEACDCSTRYFDPVCSDSGVQYFSACHAGCHNASTDGKTFYNCSCVVPHASTNVSMVSAGTCETDCTALYAFLALFFLCIFVTFLPSTPSDSATLRCIHEDHRTFGMGLKWMFIRLLGTVPGPVLFGAVTDSACRVWQTECGENSSCWIYDNSAVSRNYFLVAISMKVLSMLFFTSAYCFYAPSDEEKVPISFDGSTEHVDKNESSTIAVTEPCIIDGTNVDNVRLDLCEYDRTTQL